MTYLRKVLFYKREECYAEALSARVAVLDSCVGFIDVSKIRMCRSGGSNVMQRRVYSGHKRMHCLLYQTGTVPDGLTLHVFGLVEWK